MYICHVCVYIYIYIYMYIHIHIHICTHIVKYADTVSAKGHETSHRPGEARRRAVPRRLNSNTTILAIFYPFGLFCEIDVSLLSLQTQPNTAPNLFQMGVEYGK